MDQRVSYGVVRDKNGKPRFDGDPNKAHPAILLLLTDQEKVDLDVWTDAFAVDAQGTKRLTQTELGFHAVDALVAVSEIFIPGGAYHRVTQRFDAPAGAEFTINGG